MPPTRQGVQLRCHSVARCPRARYGRPARCISGVDRQQHARPARSSERQERERHPPAAVSAMPAPPRLTRRLSKAGPPGAAAKIGPIPVAPPNGGQDVQETLRVARVASLQLAPAVVHLATCGVLRRDAVHG